MQPLSGEFPTAGCIFVKSSKSQVNQRFAVFWRQKKTSTYLVDKFVDNVENRVWNGCYVVDNVDKSVDKWG